MLTNVRTQGLDLAGAIHRHLERRVRAALRSCATRVGAVTVCFSDINGPRGGPDLNCGITVDLIPRGSLRAEATDSDLMAALTRALARIRRSMDGAGRTGRRSRTRAA